MVEEGTIEERYGSKSEVTSYVFDHHGVRKSFSRRDRDGGLLSAANRFVKVSERFNTLNKSFWYA